LILWNQRLSYDALQLDYFKLQRTISTQKDLFPLSTLTQKDSSVSFNRAILIPVLPVNSSNHIIFPSAVSRVWIDVGAHKAAMYTLPSVEKFPDLGVIAFEPMFDMWGQLFMTKHHERLYPVPAAITPEDGTISFRRATTDMCSSIKEVDPDAKNFKWPGGCTGTNFQVTVPSLTLETVIDMLPFQTVEFLKVDAQGADFEVVKSAGKNLYRIVSFVVEIQTKPLYKDSATEEQFVDYFQSRGFKMIKKKFQNKQESEANMLFLNTRYELPTDIPVQEFFKD